jgi:hypothetical protein
MGDSIDEKGRNQTFTVPKPTLTKTAHFQTHFSNAYKRYRPYAICNMHYKYILLHTSYGSDPNPCIMRYMQYDLMHYEQVYCNLKSQGSGGILGLANGLVFSVATSVLAVFATGPQPQTLLM